MNDEVKAYKANKMLQTKVGVGSVDKEKIASLQKELEENTEDFGPMAFEFLDKLHAALVEAQQDPSGDKKVFLHKITNPVMQLKANASMFGYGLIGELANIMLTFLETVSRIDKDILAIIDAHEKTLRAIVTNKMKGDGGANGEAFKSELKGVCNRYVKRMLGKE